MYIRKTFWSITSLVLLALILLTSTKIDLKNITVKHRNIRYPNLSQTRSPVGTPDTFDINPSAVVSSLGKALEWIKDLQIYLLSLCL